MQGGELTLRPDKLFGVLKAIRPEDFYLYVTTNGFKLTKEPTKELAAHQVSRVSVSFDSMDPEVHDEMRVKRFLEKAMRLSKWYRKQVWTLI